MLDLSKGISFFVELSISLLDKPIRKSVGCNRNQKIFYGFLLKNIGYMLFSTRSSSRDAIHTYFITLIGKWTIVGGWVRHRADKRGKATELKYKSLKVSGKYR